MLQKVPPKKIPKTETNPMIPSVLIIPCMVMFPCQPGSRMISVYSAPFDKSLVAWRADPGCMAEYIHRKKIKDS